MANFSIKFHDLHDHQTTIDCCSTIDNSILITLESGYSQSIEIDKSTAIKLAKTLRAEINKIDL